MLEELSVVLVKGYHGWEHGKVHNASPAIFDHSIEDNRKNCIWNADEHFTHSYLDPVHIKDIITKGCLSMMYEHFM